MSKAIVKYNNIKAGILSEEENGEYQFVYDQEYVKNSTPSSCNSRLPHYSTTNFLCKYPPSPINRIT